MPLIPQPIVFQPAPVDNQPAQVRNVPYYDVQWNRPVFRPPSLPTQSQIWGEIPFTAHFRGPDYQRK